MPSHLTRRVFYRLLADKPLTPRRHLHRLTRSHLSAQHVYIQKRSFFGIFSQKKQQPRDPREPVLDPGMAIMLKLDRNTHSMVRPSPTPELVHAFTAFIQNKLQKHQPIEDFHATLLTLTLDTIEKSARPDNTPWLSTSDLDKSMYCLSRLLHRPNIAHRELADRLYDVLMQRPLQDSEADDDVAASRLQRYVTILTKTGATIEARDLAAGIAKNTSLSEKKKAELFRSILIGLTLENSEPELAKTIMMMDRLNILMTPAANSAIALYYAQQDNIAQTKLWFTSNILSNAFGKKAQDKILPDLSEQNLYRSLLEFCLRNDEMEWGQTIIDSSNASDNADHTWNAIFQASAAAGKGVDEVDRMISVMVRRRQEEARSNNLRPSISIFNGLIGFALSRADAYMAERYFSLLNKWAVEPNTDTFILQTEYRLLAKDYEGALVVYNNLRDKEVQTDEDWSLINKLIQTLTSIPTTKKDTIISLAADLSQRKRLFPADTVAALCSYHIQRDEYFETVDLLQTYSFQFSTSQRCQLRDLLISIALDDPKTDTARTWDTYMIFHQIFDLETDRGPRNRIMSRMFERGRPDLATHVFTRMSQHPRRDSQPNSDTYIAALTGISLTGEPEALEVVHNLLKLDTETEPSTRLYNALMLAYNSCAAPWRALEYWQTISTSPEGPSYASLHIAFRACEIAPFGFQNAQIIWRRLQQADVAIGQDLVASYVGALAGNRLFKDAADVLSGMEKLMGERPGSFVLASLFNAARGISFQEEIEAYLHDEYPVLWAELAGRGFEVDEETGHRLIKDVDRTIEP